MSHRRGGKKKLTQAAVQQRVAALGSQTCNPQNTLMPLVVERGGLEPDHVRNVATDFVKSIENLLVAAKRFQREVQCAEICPPAGKSCSDACC